MKLISATPSPYARKVRIALAEKRVAVDLVTELPWNADTTLPRFNPLEKLPVLVLDSGETWYESNLILEWIERHHPDPPLLPADPDAALATRRALVLADGVCDAFLLVFFERRRQDAHQSAPWIDRQMRKIAGGIAALEQLAGDRRFVVGQALSWGDIGIGCAMLYLDLRFPEFPWRGGHPALARYVDRLGERPSFRATPPRAQEIRDPVV